MLKQIFAGGILGTIMLGLYAEARHQVKLNTSDIALVNSDVAQVKVHQSYNTMYFIDIKKSIDELKTEIKNLKN